MATTHRHPTRKSLTYRRLTAQEMRNSLAAYRNGVSEYSDGSQAARLLKVGEQLCVLLDKEGHSDTSSAVFQALRPLYEEVRARHG